MADLVFAGAPLWLWAVFLAGVSGLLALDLGLFNRPGRIITVRRSLIASAGYILLGLAFGLVVWRWLGPAAGLEYLTGFVVEKSLAVDNLFVIALIFSSFAIPADQQNRVLLWGVLGALVLRGLMIGLGASLVAHAEWVLHLFAAFLVFTGLRMLIAHGPPGDPQSSALVRLMRRIIPVTSELRGGALFVRGPHGRSGRVVWLATPLFLALVTIEFADLVFAVDSVPAIFAITTSPFIVYTSNIFAILGLRALYVALSAVLDRFAYLKTALAVLLVFIGGKVFAAELLGWSKFPPAISLSVTFAILAAGVAWSVWRTRRPAAATAKALS